MDVCLHISETSSVKYVFYLLLLVCKMEDITETKKTGGNERKRSRVAERGGAER